ncbi:MAG: hypothetical protein K6B75_07285 [Lachnospiraceae bacterium]|nr:hypothetical protein [Lachnospiraceae bacterium]
MIPVFFILVIIFTVWFRYESKKTGNTHDDALDSYLEKEAKANLTRKKDISSLNYITIPEECLKKHPGTDPEIDYYEDRLNKLSEKKIVNLTGLTNTELKLTYGAPNLTALSSYDDNFIDLARSVYKLGRLLLEAGFREDAKNMLSFGISFGTDVSANYTLLAGIYKEENDKGSVQELIDKAEALNSLTKAKLINDLYDILDTLP